MEKYCFVIQPFDNGKFDRRYQEMIKPVIEQCGLTAYRVDQDYKVDVPVQAIEEKIDQASLIIAEITTDSPNVWFEVGYAFAKGRQVILLCSDERTSRIPFDVRHRNYLRYHTGSPGDYDEFRIKLESFVRVRIGGPDEISAEEQTMLKFISTDQKTPFSITPEERIVKYLVSEGNIQEVLKSLVRKGYLEIRMSTSDNMPYYQITEKAEQLLFRR